MQQLAKFSFETEKDSVKCMAMAVTYMRNTREGAESLNAWIFREALPFNNPAQGVTAGEKFIAHMQALANKVVAHQQQYFGYSLTTKDTDALKLTGNSAVANAVKKVSGAMKFGGDLKTLLTVGRCADFNKEKRAELEEKEMKEARRTQAGLKAEEEGFEPGTDAYAKRVEEIYNESLALTEPNASTTLPPSHGGAVFTPEDEIGKIAAEIAEEARELAKLYGNEDAINTLVVYKTKIANRIAHKLGQKTGAIQSGEVTQTETKEAA